MSRAHFEEREKFKRFVGASISKPKLEEEEEFNKFLNDLSCCVLMNRKGFEPFLCDFYEWSQQANEPETVEILMAPSGVMPGKATTIRAKLRYGVLKAKPGSAAKDPYYPAGVGLKTVGHFEPSAIGYYRHPRSKPKYRILNKEVIRAEAEKASRSYLTPEMNSLLNAINNSRSLLELEDNWDGEGSVGYDESTWLRARNFLMRNAVRLYESQKKCFDPPEILPGPKGSIDLHWKTEARELLINVPADSQETISYYGDDTAENTENAIRGKNIESSKNTEWIFLWLTQ